MKTTEVSNYNAFKEKAIEAQVLSKRVLLRDLEFNQGMSLSIQDINVGVETKAYFGLIRALGLSKTIVKKFGDVLGTDAQKSIITAMKKAQNNSNAELVVTVNPSTKKIINISNGENTTLSNPGFFGVVDDIMNVYPNLEIQGMNINSLGEIVITTINKDWDMHVPGMKKETFKLGLSFKNSIFTGTAVKPYNVRLICANGMETEEEAGFGLFLEGNSEKARQKFFTAAKELSKNTKGYQELMFGKIRSANEIVASYAELKKINKLVAATVIKDEKDMVESYFPLKEITGAYEKNGIDISKMSQKAQCNARTNVPMWDLINNLTNISSHEYGLGMDTTDKFRLQSVAGKLMFKSEYDCQTLVPAIKF